jgi:hypothetical protein
VKEGMIANDDEDKEGGGEKCESIKKPEKLNMSLEQEGMLKN